MPTEENKALVRRYVEKARNKGNTGIIDEMMTSDFKMKGNDKMAYTSKRALFFVLIALSILGIAFSFSFGRAPSLMYAHAAVPQSSTTLNVYFGSNDGYMYALNASSGALHWRVHTGSAVTYPVAVSGGVVYVPTGNSLEALNAQSGSHMWTHTAGGSAYAPAVNNGVVYFNAGDDFLYALKATDGSLLWRASVGSLFSGAYKPAIANGVVYDSASGQLFAFHTSDGSMIWQDHDYQLSGPTATAPTVFNNVVYVGTGDGNGCLYAVNAPDGSILWGLCTQFGTQSKPTIANGLVYFCTTTNVNGEVIAVSASTHMIVWSYRTTNGLALSQAAVRGKAVYAAEGKSVYALNATTGTKIWARFLGVAIGTAGTVAASNGLVYTGTSNGTLYALSQSSSTGKVVWSYGTGGPVDDEPVVA